MAEFFVNRGGGRAPEGPFDETQIIRLIAAKKLVSADICRVGALRFTKLSAHPPFARALREAGVEVKAEAVEPRAARAPKNTNRGLLLGAVLCIFGLGIAAVGIGSYVMFSNGAMPIRAAVPTDTELLFEARSVRELASDIAQLRIVDAEKLLGKQPLADAATAIANAFGVSKARSKELVLALTGAGLAARKLEVAPEAGAFLSFTSAAAVNALVASPRFKYQGLVAKNGRKYQLARASAAPSAEASALERSLDAAQLDGQTDTLVWFETSKVLFVGSPALAEAVARVLSLDVPGLEQSPAFQTAQRDLARNPNLSGYLDLSAMAEKPGLRGWLASIDPMPGPLSASATFAPAGIVTRFVVHEAKPATPAVGPSPLEFGARLTAETLAYAALTIDGALSGAERQQRLLARLAAADPRLGEQAGAALAQLETRTELKFADLLGSFGDRAALALLVPDDYALTLTGPQQLARALALEQVFAVKDEAALRAAAKQAVTSLARVPGLFSIHETADGYALATIDGSLAAELHFAGGFGFCAVGSPSLVARATLAFSKHENTLANQAAYRFAHTALANANEADLWLDAGRMSELGEASALIAPRPGEAAFDLMHALQTKGPERISASLTLARERDARGDVYRVEGLNLPLIAAIVALRGVNAP